MDSNKIKRLKHATGSCHDQVVWLVEWLEHLNMFSESQIYDIIKFLNTDNITAIEISTLSSKSVRLFNLVICDSRWIPSWTDDSFWDTATAEEVGSLPQPAITFITCDCVALIQRKNHGSKSSVSVNAIANKASQQFD